MTVEFGIFDHLDRGGRPLDRLYEERLQLVEAYDRLGYHAFFSAEHHATPLGVAPSPSVFLGAVSQRTKRILFGPLVYVVPTYSPLRLIWEVCMLDQMSRGRFQLGIGRGISPFELAYNNINYTHAPIIYREAVEVILAGLTSKLLNHDGKNFRFIDVPMELEPYQKPHPPLWSGANTPQSMGWQAERGINTIMNSPAPVVKQGVVAYTEAFRKKHGEARPLPKLGFARFVHIADTEAEAVANAKRAYASFIDSASALYRRNRVQSLNFPPDFDLARSSGSLLVGTAAQVRDAVAQQLAVSGANYFCARFMIGDLDVDAAIRSAELFAEQVIPHCRAAKAA